MTPKQQQLVDQMQDGFVLARERTSEGDVYYLGGRRVNARTVRCLLNEGAIQPSPDGLFPGCEQTYRLPEATQDQSA